MATIKQEPGAASIKSEPSDSAAHIKSEHIKSEHIKNEGLSDDEYEDAGDLDMTNGKRGLWLVKLPKFLLEIEKISMTMRKLRLGRYL